MNTTEFSFEEITEICDSRRIPLSSMERSKRQGEYRYFGAQGVIDHVDDYLFDGEYLLIAEDGENLKSLKQNIAQIVSGKFWVNNHAHIVQTNEKCELQYLCYLLNSMNLSEYVTGSAQPKLSQANMKKIKFELPVIEIQRKILHILGALDEKISLNEKINNNLEQQLSALFNEWIVNSEEYDQLDQIPLSDLCHVVTKGTTPTTLGKAFAKSGINFIKAESILNNHSFDDGKFAHIDEDTNSLLKRSIIKAEDIVFTIAGTLGRFALVDESVLPANTNQAVAIIRPDCAKISSSYIYSAFIGNWHNEYYHKRIQQAVQANLSLTTIKSLPIPILPDDKMEQYLGIITPIIKMIKGSELESKRLSCLRDTILPKLMSGEIDVSDIDL